MFAWLINTVIKRHSKRCVAVIALPHRLHTVITTQDTDPCHRHYACTHECHADPQIWQSLFTQNMDGGGFTATSRLNKTWISTFLNVHSPSHPMTSKYSVDPPTSTESFRSAVESLAPFSVMVKLFSWSLSWAKSGRWSGDWLQHTVIISYLHRQRNDNEGFILMISRSGPLNKTIE